MLDNGFQISSLTNTEIMLVPNYRGITDFGFFAQQMTKHSQ